MHLKDKAGAAQLPLLARPCLLALLTGPGEAWAGLRRGVGGAEAGLRQG